MRFAPDDPEFGFAPDHIVAAARAQLARTSS